MSNRYFKPTLVTLLAAMFAWPHTASAESQLTVGPGTATARLNFQIIIPRILYLGVGTGSAAIANNSTIDTVVFDYTTNAADVGTGAPAASITGNVVPVRVLGNNGQITIAATGSGTGLTNGTQTIAWSQINVASADATNFPAPAVGANAQPVLNSGSITNRSTNWTYSFANSNLLAPGTYTGQVTYTASMP